MITYSRLDEALLASVPAIRFRYEQEIRSWRGSGDRPGPHIVFGDVLGPAIIEDLETGKRTLLLRQAFCLLEEMSISDDPEIRDVVGQAIGEQLCERDDFPDARKLMGPATVRVIEAACEHRHRHR